MKKRWKILLIVCGVIVAIPVLQFLAFIIAVGTFDSSEQKIESEYRTQAIENVNAYIK